MSSLAAAAGIAVEDESAVVNWFQNVDQRIVHDAVAEGSGADLARLGFGDVKVSVCARQVPPCSQVTLQFEKVLLPSEFEDDGRCLVTLPPPAFPIGQQQVVPDNDLRPQVAESSGHESQ